MKVPFPALTMLLCCLAAMACGEASAQARGTAFRPVEKDRAEKLAELDTWLRRLAGRFHVSTFSRSIGEADCAAIGEGSGVHCILRISPSGDQWGAHVRMFGLDPDAPGVAYLKLNGDSTAEGGVAKLVGDSILFGGDCPVVQRPQSGTTSATVTGCRQELRIRAAPAGKVLIRNHTILQLLVNPPMGRPFRTTSAFTQELIMERAPPARTGNTRTP